MLLECRRAEDRPAFGVDDDRGAVEEKLVVAADLVHVDERHVVARGDAREEVVARAPLAAVERRRGDVEDDFRALPRQLVDRIAAVDLRAEDFVVEPEVLADGDAGADAGDARRRRLCGRLEVAQLVEDVVRRQQRFVLLEDDLAVARDDRGVVQRLAAPRGVARDAAEDERDVAGHGRERVARLERGGDEGLAVEQIARRIAGDGKLGNQDDVGAGATPSS